MQQLAKLALCALVAAALPAASAYANQVGNGSGGGYVGSIKSVSANLPGYAMNYSVGPTYAICDAGLTNITAVLIAAQSAIIQTNQCGWVGGTVGPVQVAPPPMYPERIRSTQEAEQQL